MKNIDSISVVMALFFLLIVGDVFAYGAVAVNSQTHREGVSANYPNQNAADMGALRECGSGCMVVGRYWNSCAAISWAPNGAYAYDSGYSHHEAREKAEHLCDRHAGERCRTRTLCDGGDDQRDNYDRHDRHDHYD